MRRPEKRLPRTQLVSAPYYWEKTEHAGRRAAEKEAIIAAGSEAPDIVASGEKA